MVKSKGISYRQASFQDSSDDEEKTVGTSNNIQVEILDLTQTEHKANTAIEINSVQTQLQHHGNRDTNQAPSDCCCSPRCFTTPYAVTGTIITFVLTACLVILLDLGINEGEAIGHRRPYVYLDEKNDTLVSFELRGTPEDLKKFEVIPLSDRLQLFNIELDYVIIDVTNLLSTFEHSGHFPNLQNITMKNIQFKGVMPWQDSMRSVAPASLTKLQIDYTGRSGRANGFTLDLCDTCTNMEIDPKAGIHLNMDVLRQRHCIESFLFFRRPSNWSGDLTELTYNIHLSNFGSTFVHLNNVTSEVTLKGLEFSDHLLRNVTKSKRFEPGLRFLRLSGVKLNVSTLLGLPLTLESLHIRNLDLENLQGQRLSSLFTKFTRLQELIVGSAETVPSRVNMTYYEIWLDDLPTSLKTLVLSDVLLRVNPKSKANFQLEELALKDVDIQADIIISFSKHFKVKHVYWRFQHPKEVSFSWTWIFDSVVAADPDSIFLDNWIPISNTEIYQSRAVQIISELGIRGSNSLIDIPKTIRLEKTRKHETFLGNFGHFKQTSELAYSVWSNVFKNAHFHV